MSIDVHIASLVVHVQPSHYGSLLAWLDQQPDLERHASDPSGKIVLVLEAASQHPIMATIDRIQEQPGVLGCTLVYHELMTQQEADAMETQQ